MTDGRGGRPHTEPPSAAEAAEIRRALTRIIFSGEFRSTPQLAAFLTYVVEATLAGRASAIKGYTIATEALGRGPDFDPQADPIVRVEGMRLRRALEAYYNDGGADDPIRIVIPRGAYVPTFERTRPQSAPPAAEPAPAPATPPAPPLEPVVPTTVAPDPEPSQPAAPRRPPIVDPPPVNRWRLATLVLAVAALVAIATLWAGRERHEPGAAPVDAMAHGLPVVVVDGLETAGRIPRQFSPPLLRSMIVDGLARFDGLAVVDRSSGQGLTGERYVLSLRVTGMSDGVTTAARLTHEPSGAVVWSGLIDAKEQPNPGVLPELGVARQVATTLAQPYGVLFADLRNRPEVSPRTRCLVLAYDYWRNPSREAHARARDCLERELAAPDTPAAIPANLTFLVLDEWRTGFNPRAEPLDRALGLARRAVEIGPESPRAHQALMAALFARGETDAALRQARRALELNPYDTDILADVGARHIQMGRYREGLSMIVRAASANPDAPPWYDFFQFLGHLMLGEPQAAYEAAGRIDAEDYPLGLVARAIAAHGTGDPPRAEAALQRLVAVQPDYAVDPADTLSRRRLPQEAIDRLVTGLRAAGLGKQASR